MSTLQHEPNELRQAESLLFAQFFQAYLECSDEIQESVRDMVGVLNDPESDADEREMAVCTLADLLFPNPYKGRLGLDLEEAERLAAENFDESREALQELDREETVFSERLRHVMEERGLSQSELAERIGVGQPAVSMMLSRACRPQMRTVEKIATALGVSTEELWPGRTETVNGSE